MEIPEILSSVRSQLEEKDVSPENREYIVELLGVLMSSVAAHINFALHPDALQSMAEALVNNKNLLTYIQRQSAELDALKRISVNLTASLELQKVLDAVVREAMLLVPNAQDAHIFLYHEGKLSFGASLFSDGRVNYAFADPRPEGLTYHVARERKVVMVDDLQDHPVFSEKNHSWSGSIIGLPLLMGTRVVGVMNLARTETGSFSPAEIRLLTLLADQAAIAVVNARLHQAVRGQALSDMLTGLPNRRALDERLDAEVKRASRTGHTFAVIMMDLDGFKLVNDAHGHDYGDEILRQIAQSFHKALRTTDFLARYGGDEMTLILPDTGWPDAEVVTNKIKDQIRSLEIPMPDSTIRTLSISGGVALFPNHASTAANLLRAADEALYRAKRHKRGSFELAARGTGQLTLQK